MDALDIEIDSLRLERERHRQRLAEIDIVLSAMERAASLRPARGSGLSVEVTQDAVVASNLAVGKVARKGGGRRPGDISKDWREILLEVYKQGVAQKYEEIADIAAILGNDANLSSIRERVRTLLKSGFLSGSPEDGFVVTKNAVERFGFINENVFPARNTEANTEKAEGFPGVHNPQPRPSGAQD